MKNKEILNQYKEVRKANGMRDNTIFQDMVTLNGLIEHTKGKNLKDIDAKDTQTYLNHLDNIVTKMTYASKIIKFYKWYFKLKKRERPKNMEWFEYPTAKMLRKQQDPDIKKYLITDEEYNKIVQFLKSDLKWSALFETMYLSGARPNEIMQMNIKDVDIEPDGVTITITDSKTIPRKIPLPENPKLLIRWYESHPYKNNPDSPLWISNDKKNYHNRMVTISINNKFKSIKKYTGIKKSLTPHCFRKTRATIYFSSRNPTYDDSEISKIFGWEPLMVAIRRRQYDLRNFDDLKNKIQGKIEPVETYDIVKQERDTLIEKQKKEINILKEQYSKIREVLDEILAKKIAEG